MSNKSFENRVYKSYRSALKTAPKFRASARKQYAREIASKRYKLSISEVKEIVRVLDKKNKVTHEHPEGYLEKVHFKKILEEAQKNFALNPVVCSWDGCDEIKDAQVRWNPYERRFHKIYSLVVVCSYHYVAYVPLKLAAEKA